MLDAEAYGYDPTDWYASRFDLYGALWVLCGEWHSGQWSRGYRILSRLTRAGYSPSPFLGSGRGAARFESDAQRYLYVVLARKYRHNL
jgi:hypothetical protein